MNTVKREIRTQARTKTKPLSHFFLQAKYFLILDETVLSLTVFICG